MENRKLDSSIDTDSYLHSEDCKRKRRRLKRSEEIILNEAFANNEHPKVSVMEIIAEKMNLPLAFVSRWFQNKRTREKKRRNNPDVPDSSSSPVNHFAIEEDGSPISCMYKDRSDRESAEFSPKQEDEESLEEESTEDGLNEEHVRIINEIGQIIQYVSQQSRGEQ